MTPTVQVDPEGYLSTNGIRITDQEVGRSLLQNMIFENELFYTVYDGKKVLVESFDRPYVALQVEKGPDSIWTLIGPYGFQDKFDVRKVRLDAWDRFHGITQRDISFVLSRAAQAEFFRLVDDYTDESITVDGQKIDVPEFFVKEAGSDQAGFWGNYYKTGSLPPWDLNQYNPNLDGIFAQLKLNKSKILVLGAGQGHDAEFFAERGHIVTAVDYSEDARKSFQMRYPQSNVDYQVKDVFQPPPGWTNSFDIVFDHTLFCAVPPQKRKKLVQTWKQVLKPRGHLLAIFYLLHRIHGPPYSVTEWELQQFMQKDFDFIYWSRAKKSMPAREHKEIIVYAQKK